MQSADFQSWLAAQQHRFEDVMSRLLPAPDIAPQRLHQAMRYSVLDGGKRVRPLSLLLSAACFGPIPPVARELAASEVLHGARTLVGAAGTEIWRFRAVGKGKLTLRLGYFRSFAPAQVARRFRVDFRVS